MATVVKSRIIRVGNSKGVRIPKLFLEQVNLGDEIELVLQDDQVVIRPALAARHGWEDAFREMAETGDDRLLMEDEPLATEWEETGWEW